MMSDSPLNFLFFFFFFWVFVFFFLVKGCISLNYAWYFSHMSDINGREGDREGLIVHGHTQVLKQQANYYMSLPSGG